MKKTASHFKDISDQELISLLFTGDASAIVYFFYQKYLAAFRYHIYKIFPYSVEVNDLIDEFYLYLFENNWKRLRTYNPDESSLNTWISVVAYRFFKNYKFRMIDSNGLISIQEEWDESAKAWTQNCDNEIKMDVSKAIEQIKNLRDRKIVELLIYDHLSPQDIAKEYNLAVDYVYTIKNRTLKLLRLQLNDYL